MEARSVGAVVNLVVIAAYAVGAAWRGYFRRRAHWTRGSWIGLCSVVLVGLSLLALTFVFSAAVDNHEAWVGAPRSSARGGWLLVSLGSMIGGVLLAAGSLGWFAVGEPTQQFPVLGFHRRARRALPTPDHPAEPRTSAPRRLQPNEELWRTPLAMTSAETTLTRAFDDLATLVERTGSRCVRIQRADGTAIEGDVLDVGYNNLFVLDEASRTHVRVFAHELQALDVSMPRRAREWLLAAGAIPGATAALVGYAQLPWVPERPEGGDILMGFMILLAIGAGVISIPLLRKWLASWVTKWQRVYPPVAPNEEL